MMVRSLAALGALALLHESLVLAESSQKECADCEGDSNSLLQFRSERTGLKCGSSGDDCPDEEDKKIVVGVINTVFHNVTGWVYAKALEQLGLEVKVVDDYGHPLLYPMFTGNTSTGGAGTASGYTCTEEGCADLCKAQGLGNKSPCIDYLIDSQTPGYHAMFTYDHKDDWTMHGTAFEGFMQTLYVPYYTGITTLSEAAKDETMSKEILSWPSGATGTDGCTAMFCPACPSSYTDVEAREKAFPYIFSGPLKEAGFTLKTLPCPEFKDTVEKMLKEKKHFLSYNWAVSPWNGWFGKYWHPLDLEQWRDYAYIIPRKGAPNILTPGRGLIRKASMHKFSKKTLSVLASIFIGNEGVGEMGSWALGEGLCPSQSFDSACAAEAAQKWIDQNNVTDGKTPPNMLDVWTKFGTWPSDFW